MTTDAEFSAFVLSKLHPFTSPLVKVLAQLLRDELPQEVASIHFEVFPDGFTSGFPVRAFFLDQYNTEFFRKQNGEAHYPTSIDPGLLVIPHVYERKAERQFEGDDRDVFTLAGNALIPWFRRCWLEAGGADFPRLATIGLHDDPPVKL